MRHYQDVIANESLLFQIQLSEQNSLLYVEEDYMTIFSSFSIFNHHTILVIDCVHASNWFIHLQPTWQIDDQTILFLLCENKNIKNVKRCIEM